MRILVLEDNPDDFLLVQKRLREVPGAVAEFELEHVSYLKEAKKRLAEGGFDLVLSDLQVPDSQGTETVLELIKEAPQVPVVALTGAYIEEQMALEAVRKGAQDYLTKQDLSGKALVRTIRYAIERHQIQEALTKVKRELEAKVRELESFNKIMMGREERILELKEENKQLKKALETSRPKDER